jgi:hypothetical protein
MVLEHQTRMTNLIVRLGYEARIAGQPSPEVDNAAEELLRYMLFTDEAPLDAPISGNLEYVKDFESAGPRDKRGRTLRELQLDGRLMRYPCSYMIYSEAVDALPAFAKDRLYRRLWEVLTGEDQSPPFESLSQPDRRAILEILHDTKPDLPAYW